MFKYINILFILSESLRSTLPFREKYDTYSTFTENIKENFFKQDFHGKYQ